MTVHRLPPRFIGDSSYPPRGVIIAPDPIEPAVWLAWVIGKRGPVILESGRRDHVVSDAYTFASRFALLVEERAAPLVTDSIYRPKQKNGVIYIAPSERDGGSWNICHESRSGDSDAVVANCFSLGEAETLAKAIATDLGAEVSL